MGLDTTHDCWHGAYSSFQRWRDKIAEVGGYTFHPSNEPANYDIDWGNIQTTIGNDLLGRWPKMPVRPDGTEDPLIILLAHSDCEGMIQAEFTSALADRLEKLIPLLEKEGEGGGHIGSYADKTRTFVEGLRRAVEANEDVEFY